MKTKDELNITKKEVKQELHVCSKRMYERDFHVSFPKYGEAEKVILIRPKCGKLHSVYWRVTAHTRQK